MAAQEGNVGVVRLLIKAKAHVSIQTEVRILYDVCVELIMTQTFSEKRPYACMGYSIHVLLVYVNSVLNY